jgi:hypothetical protein
MVEEGRRRAGQEVAYIAAASVDKLKRPGHSESQSYCRNPQLG